MPQVKGISCAKMVPRARTDQNETVRCANQRKIMDRQKEGMKAGKSTNKLIKEVGKEKKSL